MHRSCFANKYIWIILSALLLVSCSSVPQPQPSSEAIQGLPASVPPLLPAFFEDGPGVEVIGIRHSAAGYMMDFRYRITDSQKALPLFNKESKPYLLHEKSGARFMVPNPAKIGPLRATTMMPEVGRMFYIFFANPGRYVKQGDLVTVVVGEIKFEHLVMQ